MAFLSFESSVELKTRNEIGKFRHKRISVFVEFEELVDILSSLQIVFEQTVQQAHRHMLLNRTTLM